MYKPTSRRIINDQTPNEPRLIYIPSMDDKFKRSNAKNFINIFLEYISRVRK